MKEIQLTQGKVALVDDEDYEWLSKWRWHAGFLNGLWYAKRTERTGLKFKSILMHRVIMETPENMDVDHKDGNGLNNQRFNIRNCTTSENTANKKMSKNNKSGYKGAILHKPSGKWHAFIVVNRRNIYLGSYSTPELAAHAYDEAAKNHFGEFARLNFPK